MSSPTEESSVKNLITQSSSSYNNKSLDGDIIFVGDYIDLNKTPDAVVDLTEESSAKMNNLITQSSNDDDAKRNLVDGEGKVADTLLPYKLPFSATRLSRSFVTIQSGVKVNTAVTKREKWLCDGNKWDDIVPDRELPCNVMYMVVDIETHDWKDGGPRSGRIVEMAWMVFDCDMKCLESKQYLLKPHGYDRIAQKATACHGITTERAVDDGLTLSMFLMSLLPSSTNSQVMALLLPITWNTKTRSLSAISTKSNKFCGVMLRSVTLGHSNYVNIYPRKLRKNIKFISGNLALNSLNSIVMCVPKTTMIVSNFHTWLWKMLK